jgi:hypothetical protein
MTRLLLLVLCCAAAWAQADAERGKRIVDEALAALGGERFLSTTSRVETGRAYSFFREEVFGLAQAVIYTTYAAPVGGASGPLATRERQSFLRNKKEESAVLFTASGGFQITFRGARPMADDSFERYKLTTLHNILYILRVRLKEPGLIIESRGRDIWANQQVEVVDITDSENRVVKVYFDLTSKFPVRQVFHRRDPKTRAKIEEVAEFGKYRETASGIWWPFTTLRTRDGEKIYEMFAESVSFNEPLSDSLFILPTSTPILKKLIGSGD